MNERAEEFLRKLGLTPESVEEEVLVTGSDVLPEQCLWCGEEFIYDLQSGEPPTMLAECSCGQWRMVFVG